MIPSGTLRVDSSEARFQRPASHADSNNTPTQARRDIVLRCIPDKDTQRRPTNRRTLDRNRVFRAIPLRPNKTNRYLGVSGASGPERSPIVSANTLLKQIHRDVKFMVAPEECLWTKELCCAGVVRGARGGGRGCFRRFSNH